MRFDHIVPPHNSRLYTRRDRYGAPHFQDSIFFLSTYAKWAVRISHILVDKDTRGEISHTEGRIMSWHQKLSDGVFSILKITKESNAFDEWFRDHGLISYRLYDTTNALKTFYLIPQMSDAEEMEFNLVFTGDFIRMPDLENYHDIEISIMTL